MKKLILVISAMIIVLSTAMAAPGGDNDNTSPITGTTTENLWFYFTIIRYSTFEMSFADPDENAFTDNSCALDIEKGLDDTQALLIVTTTSLSSYTITFSFDLMDCNEDSTFTNGFYDVCIGGGTDSESSTESVTEDATSISRGSTGDTNFTLAFDFTNYLDSYVTGTYQGTISATVTTT